MTRAAQSGPLIALALLVASTTGCGGDSTTTAGLIMSITPSLCIARAEAGGVCVPGDDAEGHTVGECVTFTYDGTPGDASAIRDIQSVDAADHPDDCPEPG
jgi:hypothetical protein